MENQGTLEIDYKVKASELEAKLAEREVAERREAQKSRAIVEAAEKGLPVELAREFCIGNSNEETLKKITVFSAAFEQEVSKRVNSIVSQRFESGGRDIEKVGAVKGLSIDSIKKMTTEEILADYDNVLKVIKR
jgi:hypothetical protein